MHYVQLSGFIQALAELIGAVSFAYGVIKTVPYFWARYKLVEEFRAERAQRIAWQRRAEIAESTVTALQDMIAGWETIREEVRQEMSMLRGQLGSAVLWIGDALHARDSGSANLPPLPDNLKDAITESLRQRGGSFVPEAER